MRKMAAAALAAGLMFASAPALAQDDPLKALQELIRLEQSQPQFGGVTPAIGGDLNSLVAPSPAEVAVQIDQQPGDTQEERAGAYIKQVERRLALEPGAQPLYDALALAQAYTRHAGSIQVYVRGQRVDFDVQPVIVGGRTLVPIRYVVERLGGQVGWNQERLTVTVTLGQTRVEVVQDSTAARVNGRPVTLDVAATIIDGRTMVPLRFVSESLNQQVDYHPGSAGTAVISIVSK